MLAADQVSKWLVRRVAADLPMDVVGGVHLQLTYNSGISFSRLAGAGTILVVLVAAVVGGVAVALPLSAPRYRPALGLILGGAIGNLVDRLRFDGAVVDFISVYAWPSFNLADAAIVVGTLLLAFLVLRGQRG